METETKLELLDIQETFTQNELRFAGLINEIQNTKGKGSAAKKLELLEATKQDPEFEKMVKQYLQQIMDPRPNLFQTDINPDLVKGLVLKSLAKDKVSLATAMEIAFAEANRTEKYAKTLATLYHRLPDELKHVFKLFIFRELKAGLGAKTINNVWKDLIYYIPYNRCSTFTTALVSGWDFEKGVYSQVKYDGMFQYLEVHIHRNDKPEQSEQDSKIQLDTKWISRQGKITKAAALDELANQVAGGVVLKENIDPTWYGDLHVVFQGELVLYDQNNNLIDREKSNGLFNAIASGEETLPQGYRAFYRIWDIINYDDFKNGESKVPYSESFAYIQSMFDIVVKDMAFWSDVGFNDLNYGICETRIVHSVEELMAHFKELLARGEEGTVVKAPNLTFKDSAGNKLMLKLKLVMDIELRVVGFNQGDKNGKHSDTFGSIQMESQDGRIVTGVAGITDSLREKIHANREYYMDKIFTVRCNGIQYTDDLEIPHSLYFPRILGEVRLDKDMADTFEYIEEVQKSKIK